MMYNSTFKDKRACRAPVVEPGNVLKELPLHIWSIGKVPLPSGREEVRGACAQSAVPRGQNTANRPLKAEVQTHQAAVCPETGT